MDIQRKGRKKAQKAPGNYNLRQPKQTISRSYEESINVPAVAPIKEIHQRKSIWHYIKKILFFCFIALLIALIGIVIYFTWKTFSTHYRATHDETVLPAEQERPFAIPFEDLAIESSSLEQYDRVNILLLGKASEDYPGTDLTDTIMIASIDTIDKKIALFSLPRDLYVNIPDTDYYTRINSVYQYGLTNKEGIEPLKETIEDITGQEIHFYIIADFDGFTDIVDSLGGINVDVLRDINDTRYPGPNRSYQTFELEKGLQNMDGETALKYVRYRHGDPEGDFGRAKRQQQVLQALKNRAFSLKTIFNPFAMNALLNSLGDHIRTDISAADMTQFVTLIKKLDTQNIATVVVDAWKPDSLLRVMHVQHGPIRAFGLVPRTGSYTEIRDLAENVFDADKIKQRKEKVITENAKIIIVDRSATPGLAFKVQKLLTKDLGLTNVAMKKTELSGIEEETVVVDYSNGNTSFTIDEIIRQLEVKREDRNIYADSITEEADVIIVVGRDLADQLLYEEATINELNDAAIDQQYLDVIEKK